jgi:predicted component of type VI protein secretion system
MLVATVLAGPGQLAAAAPPVVVAVDTSRSLEAAELREATKLLAATVERLPAGTSVGLIAFDDSPTWLVPVNGSPAEVVSSLEGVTPSGRFTLLHDALFVATRALADGGVVLLATDGRDENSATTVDDLARLSGANHVRIVAVSHGDRIDPLALRRLALVTEGEYLGPSADVTAEDLVGTVTNARDELAAEIEEAETAADTTAATTAAPAPERVVTREVATTPDWLLPLLAAVVLIAFVPLVVLLLTRRSAGRSEPTAPSSEAAGDADWDTDPMLAATGTTQSTPPPRQDWDTDPMVAAGQSTAPTAKQADEVDLDPSAFEKLPFDGDLEKTSVLDEQYLLVVRQPGAKERTFRLRGDRAFAVGRAPRVNTLTLAEPTLSGQHFKIVPKDGAFYIVDLETTNGTVVNGARVRAHRLEPGDTIRAGNVTFELRLTLQPLG